MTNVVEGVTYEVPEADLPTDDAGTAYRRMIAAQRDAQIEGTLGRLIIQYAIARMELKTFADKYPHIRQAIDPLLKITP